MPDSNPGPLPQKSGALPMSHHIYCFSVGKEEERSVAISRCFKWGQGFVNSSRAYVAGSKQIKMRSGPILRRGVKILENRTGTVTF